MLRLLDGINNHCSEFMKHPTHICARDETADGSKQDYCPGAFVSLELPLIALELPRLINRSCIKILQACTR